MNELQQIGERIRGLRDILDLPAETLAAQLQIPVAVLDQYERGAIDIPVSVLYNIAKCCHVELGSLLMGEEPRLRVYTIVRNGHGIKIDRRKEYSHQSLAANFVDKKAEPFLVTVQPEADDVPVSLNRHPGQEFNYVLSGTVKLTIGTHEVQLQEGDAIYFDSGVPHGMKAAGNTPAQFLAIIL